MNLAVDLRTVADNTSVNYGLFRNILWWNIGTVGIDLPEFFIEVELGDNID